MKNSEQPINPIDKLSNVLAYGIGLTKREYFAGLALSSGKSAKESVSLADELLIELENEQFKKTNG